MVVEFQVAVYGEVVAAEPMSVLSTSNWTLATATLSEAVAVSITEEPETVELAVGAVIETVGGVVSGVLPPPPPPPSPPPPPPPPPTTMGAITPGVVVAVDDAAAVIVEGEGAVDAAEGSHAFV